RATNVARPRCASWAVAGGAPTAEYTKLTRPTGPQVGEVIDMSSKVAANTRRLSNRDLHRGVVEGAQNPLGGRDICCKQPRARASSPGRSRRPESARFRCVLC